MFKKCRYKKHEGDSLVELSLMTKDKHRKDGYGDICKKCGYLRKKDYVKRIYNGDESLQSVNTFRHKSNNSNIKLRIRGGLAKSLWFSSKNRAKAKNLEFTIIQEDVVIPLYCPILGIELIRTPLIHNQNVNEKRRVGINLLPDNYPSIDRINCNIGYTKDNIHVISWRANHLKSNSNFNEIQKLYEWYRTSICN